MRNIKIHLFVLLFAVQLTSCDCDFLGARDLGNKLSLFEGDKLEDRVIVYCSSYSATECCTGGIYVIPKYDDHYDGEGGYAEYVKEAQSNKDWVIANSIQIKGKKENYWIIKKGFDIESFDCDKINCDSIIQSYVTGPLDYRSFSEKIKDWNINLEF